MFFLHSVNLNLVTKVFPTDEVTKTQEADLKDKEGDIKEKERITKLTTEEVFNHQSSIYS